MDLFHMDTVRNFQENRGLNSVFYLFLHFVSNLKKYETNS